MDGFLTQNYEFANVGEKIMKNLRILLLTMVMVLFITALGNAQVYELENDEGMNFQLFRPSIFGTDFIAIDDADTLKQLGFGFGVYYDYANSLFSYFKEVDDTEAEFDILSELHTGHFFLAFGITDWWSIGGHLPAHYMRYREFTNDHPISVIGEQLEESDIMLGDAMAKMKFRLLRQDKHWLGMALIPYGYFPTGDTEYLTGEGRITGGGKLALEHDFGYFNFGLNGGYLYRGEKNILLDAEMGDAVTYGAGVSKMWPVGVGFGIEYWGSVYSVDDVAKVKNLPMELTATLRFKLGKRGPRLVAGGGPGLSNGAGSPTYRLIGGLDYHWRPADLGELNVRTVDQDGKLISADLKISDKDGLTTSANTSGKWNKTVTPGSYNVGATKEGYEPASGNAAVAEGEEIVLTLVLKAIPAPKTIININVIDRCTKENIAATIKFGDGTTIIAKGGKYTREVAPGAYTVNVTAGNYESKSATVNVTEGQTTVSGIKLYKKIEKTGKVHFATNSHVILAKSYYVLDNVAKQINGLCEFDQVTIEGHTDSRGNDAFNLKLSQRRADSVKAYLISKGIDGAKLNTMAYGESKPIGSNDTKEGRAENRRVEFLIK